MKPDRPLPCKPAATTRRHRAAAALCALLLTACGGGGDTANSGAVTSTTTMVDIQGVAATGAAIGKAAVTVINRRGEKAGTVSAADGSFGVRIADAAPYLLSVTDAAGRTWYSYAPSAGRANLTPLTTLALLQANGRQPLAELASNWPTRQLGDTQVLEGAKVVNANLAAVMQRNGVAPGATNVFTASFSANGSGLDAVLDALRVTINCSANSCTETVTGPNGSALVTWNGNIATGGLTFSWTTSGSSGAVDVGIGSCRAPKAGTYSLLVQTSVSGLGTVSVPDVCIDGLPTKPASQAGFCGDTTIQQQLPPSVLIVTCSYDGSSGTIAARITSPIVLDYAVKYTFIAH